MKPSQPAKLIKLDAKAQGQNSRLAKVRQALSGRGVLIMRKLFTSTQLSVKALPLTCTALSLLAISLNVSVLAGRLSLWAVLVSHAWQIITSGMLLWFSFNAARHRPKISVINGISAVFISTI